MWLAMLEDLGDEPGAGDWGRELPFPDSPSSSCSGFGQSRS